MKKGFTIIELTIILAILSIIFAYSSYSFYGHLNIHRSYKTIKNLNQDIRSAQQDSKESGDESIIYLYNKRNTNFCPPNIDVCFDKKESCTRSLYCIVKENDGDPSVVVKKTLGTTSLIFEGSDENGLKTINLNDDGLFDLTDDSGKNIIEFKHTSLEDLPIIKLHSSGLTEIISNE